MFNEYDIKNNIAGIQNLLVTESIRETSNLQLLKSEEAIKNVIESYADKFNAVGGKLTDITKHYVSNKEVIDKKQFNDLFDSLYLDIKTLYKELEYVDEILNLNLGRNKKFFGILKKRMRELWNKLYLTRLNINDSSTFDESYFESFSTIASQHKYSNVLIDKKTGMMTLAPRKTTIQNKKYLIKNISSKTFPVHNVDGGVIHTTNYLNSFANSYRRDGTRDMLENGLWKEQVLTKDIPEIKYNLSESDTVPLWMNVTGILSLVDIEYTYPVELNNFDIDVFGENTTGLIAILYKTADSDDWIPMKKLVEKQISGGLDYIDNFKSISSFDILNVRNLELVKAKHIRLVFNQQNYELLDTSKLNIEDSSEKINEDLAERRYEVVRLDGGSDDAPAIPKSYDNDSLYSKITDIIENTKSLEKTLNDITAVLEPVPELVTVDFSKTLKYEVGAWQIEPSLKKYQGTGKFDSGDYKLTDRSLITVNLSTKQESLNYNTCNWYVSTPNNDVYIPILENNSSIRKEPANIIRPKYYEDLGWRTGYFIQLDFPMNPTLWQSAKIYVNGIATPISSFTYYIMNSTLLYVENITDPYKNDYVIQYIPSTYQSANVYILDRIKEYNSADTTEYQVVAARKSVIKTFINDINGIDKYNIKKSRCTTDEYYKYFITGKHLCTTQSVYDGLSSEIKSKFSINPVPELRSVTYASYLGGSYNKDLAEGSLASAIPIIIERDLQ